MKYLFNIFLGLLIFSGCKKPKVGRYELILIYDQSNKGTVSVYGDEYKVTSKNIYYGGAFSDISGTLHRNFKNVSGDLVLFPNSAIENIITVDGTIKIDGVNKHRIEGVFSDPPYSGKFKINEI